MRVLIFILSFVFAFGDVYILDSDVNLKRYKELKLDIEDFHKRQEHLKKVIQKYTKKVKIIKSVDNITPKDVLFVIDTFALSQKTQKKLIKFVANGGRIVFNFKSVFLDENSRRTHFLEKITNLKIKGYAKRDKDHIFFVIQDLLSPIKIPEAKRLDLVIYDTIPILDGKKPDLIYSNWSITEPMRYNGKFIPSGMLWDGKYKKGGWIYFSLPFYTFLHDSDWNGLLNSIVKYAVTGISVVKYPFLKYDKMVFVSEDTEYKFVNFNNFINALNKYDLNGTAFCVGKIAKNYPNLMKKAGSNKNLEIGSHSYSHTKLIDEPLEFFYNQEIKYNNQLLSKLSSQIVKGFRPPREELNKKMIEKMENSSLSYVLAKNLGQLRAKYIGKLMFISRIGTDDYQYIMELDWTPKQIVENMKREVDFLMNLHALFTLSTHTHLMCYKSNIKMLEQFLSYVKKKKYPMLKGRDIVNLIYKTDNIHMNVDKNKIIIYNTNKLEIKKFIFRVYFLEKMFKLSSKLNFKIKKYDYYQDITIKNLPIGKSIIYLEKIN